MYLLSISIVINCIKTVPSDDQSASETKTTTKMITSSMKLHVADQATESMLSRIAHSHDAWEIADITINVYFLIEFIIRVISAPKKLDFCKSLLAWIDFIALASFIPVVNKHYMDESVILFFTPFQLFRVIRIFRVTRLLPGYNITEIIMKDSIGYLEIFFSWLMFASTIAAYLLYTVETDQLSSDFTSLPQSQYWAIQTAVTLGYGDIIPQTGWGKLFAACFIICFIPTIHLPAFAILARFSKFYEFCKNLNTERC